MIISVASGKGGTGKTMVATNLAASIATDVKLLDCDVEQPNAHLFIRPVLDASATVTTPVPEIGLNLCDRCGKCADLCEFNTIAVAGETVMVFEELCHSCGGCMAVCPAKTITEKGRELGVLQKGHRNGIEFIHGKLRVGEAMSPPLIKRVLASADLARLTIVDAPPGTSCSVIASIGGATAVLIVTEPTVSGQHDMERAAQLAAHFNIACLGRIPFDPIFTKAMIKAQTIFEYNTGSEAEKAVANIWQRLPAEIGSN
jgi:MinD superfamily P-loop ATPase